MNHRCCAALQEGLGRNGLNGLPGNPGLKVWTSSSLNLECQRMCFLASFASIAHIKLVCVEKSFEGCFGMVQKVWRWKPDVKCRESRDREESLDWWVHDYVFCFSHVTQWHRLPLTGKATATYKYARFLTAKFLLFCCRGERKETRGALESPGFLVYQEVQ